VLSHSLDSDLSNAAMAMGYGLLDRIGKSKILFFVSIISYHLQLAQTPNELSVIPLLRYRALNLLFS
jgi:hypothetical protein